MALVEGWVLGDSGLLKVLQRSALADAVKSQIGLDLAYRPKDWKLDNKATSLLPDLAHYGDLTVGDRVAFREDRSAYLWNLVPHDVFLLNIPESLTFTILCFARIVGKFRKSKVPMETTGCMLTLYDEKETHRLSDPMWNHHIGWRMPLSDSSVLVGLKNHKILLFWAEALSKV